MQRGAKAPASGGRHLLAEPGHRPVEVMQLQPVDPGDPVVGHPFVAAAVRARHEQPVQNAGKDGALDRKLKAAVLQAARPTPRQCRAAPRCAQTAAARQCACRRCGPPPCRTG